MNTLKKPNYRKNHKIINDIFYQGFYQILFPILEECNLGIKWESRDKILWLFYKFKLIKLSDFFGA